MSNSGPAGCVPGPIGDGLLLLLPTAPPPAETEPVPPLPLAEAMLGLLEETPPSPGPAADCSSDRVPGRVPLVLMALSVNCWSCIAEAEVPSPWGATDWTGDDGDRPAGAGGRDPVGDSRETRSELPERAIEKRLREGREIALGG